jgi:signal transduction histidine kinase/ActR/RegA family two-component response regulator
MDQLHKLLLRQLKRAQIDLEKDDIPEKFLKLLSYVSNFYNEADQGRYIIERSLEISSKEMLQLNESLQREKDVLQSVTSEGICVIDPFWQITNLNLTGSKLLSCYPKAAIGEFFYKFFTLYDNENDQTKEVTIDILREKAIKGEIYHCERGILKSMHGTTHPVSFSINPLPLIGKNLFGGAVLIITDATQRIETERLLLDSLKAAEQSSKAKMLFLANMSHEIRTPMNGIIGMLQLLIHTTLDETQKNYVEKSFENASSLLRIIGDILDFSKIESGKVDFENTEFNIQAEFSAMIALFKPQCEDKSLQIELTIDDKIPNMVIGDAFRIKQIMNNLVNNAIKFTPEHGHITISIDLLEIHLDNLTLEISVIDTGIGVPESFQGKIFDIFSQADESTTRKYGGTGLGLAITKHLVEQMGGKIELSSEEGKGSTFTFSLKLGLPQNQFKHLPKTTLPISNLPQFKANILLVEDNHLNQIVVNDMLRSLGCKIDIVDSGQEAIDAVKKQNYDLIFMDCHMPEMDGFKVTKEIRALESQHNTNNSKNIIVALTANTLKGTKERCKDVGMDDYLSKPLNYSQLCGTLIKYLTAKRDMGQ